MIKQDHAFGFLTLCDEESDEEDPHHGEDGGSVDGGEGLGGAAANLTGNLELKATEYFIPCIEWSPLNRDFIELRTEALAQ